MKVIQIGLPKDINIKAYNYNLFRLKCKNYLKNNAIDFDKFTMVEHDSIVGYISEEIVSNYLKSTYSKIKVSSWDYYFDMGRIQNILDSESVNQNDIDYVKTYFYDQWDLKIIIGELVYFIDVKSASTTKSPSDTWNFLYPKVQVEKAGKTGAILGYCVFTDTTDISSLKNFVLIGYISLKKIKNCFLQTKGTKTRFGTISQIDNYITELKTDYEDLDKILK